MHTLERNQEGKYKGESFSLGDWDQVMRKSKESTAIFPLPDPFCVPVAALKQLSTDSWMKDFPFQMLGIHGDSGAAPPPIQVK